MVIISWLSNLSYRTTVRVPPFVERVVHALFKDRSILSDEASTQLHSTVSKRHRRPNVNPSAERQVIRCIRNERSPSRAMTVGTLGRNKNGTVRTRLRGNRAPEVIAFLVLVMVDHIILALHEALRTVAVRVCDDRGGSGDNLARGIKVVTIKVIKIYQMAPHTAKHTRIPGVCLGLNPHEIIPGSSRLLRAPLAVIRGRIVNGVLGGVDYVTGAVRNLEFRIIEVVRLDAKGRVREVRHGIVGHRQGLGAREAVCTLDLDIVRASLRRWLCCRLRLTVGLGVGNNSEVVGRELLVDRLVLLEVPILEEASTRDNRSLACKRVGRVKLVVCDIGRVDEVVVERACLPRIPRPVLRLGADAILARIGRLGSELVAVLVGEDELVVARVDVVAVVVTHLDARRDGRAAGERGIPLLKGDRVEYLAVNDTELGTSGAAVGGTIVGPSLDIVGAGRRRRFGSPAFFVVSPEVKGVLRGIDLIARRVRHLELELPQHIRHDVDARKFGDGAECHAHRILARVVAFTRELDGVVAGLGRETCGFSTVFGVGDDLEIAAVEACVDRFVVFDIPIVKGTLYLRSLTHENIRRPEPEAAYVPRVDDGIANGVRLRSAYLCLRVDPVFTGFGGLGLKLIAVFIGKDEVVVFGFDNLPVAANLNIRRHGAANAEYIKPIGIYKVAVIQIDFLGIALAACIDVVVGDVCRVAGNDRALFERLGKRGHGHEPQYQRRLDEHPERHVHDFLVHYASHFSRGIEAKNKLNRRLPPASRNAIPSQLKVRVKPGKRGVVKGRASRQGPSS